MKITHEQFQEALQVQRKAYALIDSVDTRCDEIVRKLCNIYGKKLSWWIYSNGAGEDKGDGFFDVDEYKNAVETKLHGKTNGWINDFDCIIDGDTWDLAQSFPSKFLYEDFEAEVVEGKKLHEKMEEKRKVRDHQKRAKKKLRQEEVLQAAKSKLSKEELKALGIR